MASVLDKVTEIAVVSGYADRKKCVPTSAIYQDLGVNGDPGEDFVAALCDEFGEWVGGWPWHRFADFNEPPVEFGARIWKVFRLPNPEIAFPGYVEERLELGHIAAVIEKGEWFEP